jgi:hypothetical protein
LHVRKQPVAAVIDAELAVIDLEVLGLTLGLLGGENLDVCSVIVFPPWQRPATLSCKFGFGGISVRPCEHAYATDADAVWRSSQA